MGQKAEASLGIMDSQSVRWGNNNRSLSGIDVNKKIKGVKIILADAGYRGEIAGKTKTVFGYILEVVVSGDKVNGFKPIGKRWMVERTFAWFDNYRRLCRNDELTFDSVEEMVKLAAIRMILNKI